MIDVAARGDRADDELLEEAVPSAGWREVYAALECPPPERA